MPLGASGAGRARPPWSAPRAAGRASVSWVPMWQSTPRACSPFMRLALRGRARSPPRRARRTWRSSARWRCSGGCARPRPGSPAGRTAPACPAAAPPRPARASSSALSTLKSRMPARSALGHLVARLAHAGEDDRPRPARRPEHPGQLAAGDDVEAAPSPRSSAQQREVGVGLHRVADAVAARRRRPRSAPGSAAAASPSNRRRWACPPRPRCAQSGTPSAWSAPRR